MKSILVVMNGTAGDKAVLAEALKVGHLFDSHLRCIHVVPNPRSLLRRAISVEMGASMLPADAISALRTQAEARAEAARGTFGAFCQRNGIKLADPSRTQEEAEAEFQSAVADPFEEVLKQTRFHDAVIIEAPTRTDGAISQSDLGRLAVEAGRPVILVPPEARQEPFETVAIAWRSGAEAARAVTAALPILMKAKITHIFGAVGAPEDEAVCREDLEAVARQLRRHGIQATAHVLASGRNNGCDAILAAASKLDADLLVMGAYGHSRVRELVLGGFTQQVLDGVALPVLLFH